LEFNDEPMPISRYFDPRIDLTFESEEEARERNRQLAWNLKEAKAPEATLYELL
jgi:hypothetical protein